MSQLFDCSTDNIGLHLKNIFHIMRLLIKDIFQSIRGINGMILCVWRRIANIIELYQVRQIVAVQEN